MAKIYHGTTYKNYLNILKNGFQTGKKVWNCSENNFTYAYELERYKRDNCCDDDENEYIIDMIIRDCFDSACIAAAYLNLFDSRLIVLELDVPDELIGDDESVYNQMTGDRVMTMAVEVHNDDLTVDMIQRVFISESYCPSLRLLYVSHMLRGHDYFNTDTFSELELSIAQKLNVADFLFSEDCEWELLEKTSEKVTEMV